MSGTDSIKGLIALSINIDFGKQSKAEGGENYQSKAEGQIKRLEEHGFELLTDSKVQIEQSKYNLKDIVFLDGFSYYLYKFKDSKSYTILRINMEDIRQGTAFVVIQQDSKILETPEQFLRECNLKWYKRILAKLRNQSFKINLQPLQDVEGYIAIDRSTVLESVFPLKYEPSNPNFGRLVMFLFGWGLSVLLINYVIDSISSISSISIMNFQIKDILDYIKPFIFSFIGLIASSLLKEDLEPFLSSLKKNKATKLTLTGLATIEPVSDKAKEINAQVEEVNLELSNLKPH